MTSRPNTATRRSKREARSHSRPWAISVPAGREYNEDSSAALSFNPRQNAWGLTALLVVADGMGGHQDGAAASRIAVETIIEVLGASRTDIADFSSDWRLASLEEVVERAIKLANNRVYAQGGAGVSGRPMGTTLTVIAIRRDEAVVGHVGDSRAYHLTRGGFSQLTQDHSYVAEQVRKGAMTEDEAARSPFRTQITRTVGTKESVEPDVRTFLVSQSSAFVLCSDGLTGVVGDAEIQGVLHRCGSAKQAARALVVLAERNNTEDNVSVALIDLGDVLGSRRAIVPETILPWVAAMAAGALVGLVALLVFSHLMLPARQRHVGAAKDQPEITQARSEQDSSPTTEATQPVQPSSQNIDEQLDNAAHASSTYKIKVELTKKGFLISPAGAPGTFHLKLAERKRTVTEQGGQLYCKFDWPGESYKTLSSDSACLGFEAEKEGEESVVYWRAKDTNIVRLPGPGKYKCYYQSEGKKPTMLYFFRVVPEAG